MSEFDELVREAVESLPDEFRERLDNVEIVVEDIPNRHQLTSVGARHPLGLFGLYQGVPKTKRGSGYMFVAPDKITIFRIPILTYFKTPKAIKEKVKRVVLHEIGHHFGLSEEELAKRPKAL